MTATERGVMLLLASALAYALRLMPPSAATAPIHKALDAFNALKMSNEVH